MKKFGIFLFFIFISAALFADDGEIQWVTNYDEAPDSDTEDLLVGGEYPIDPESENALKAYEILADFMGETQPGLNIELPSEATAQIVAGYLISINCPCFDRESRFEGNIYAKIYFIWDDSFEILEYELAMINRSKAGK